MVAVSDTRLFSSIHRARHIKRILFSLIFFICTSAVYSQAYWQQHVNYVMDVQLDVNTNLITGTQKISYTNNSPDTIRRLFFHLFYNAFHPGSMMDELSSSTENLVIGHDAKGKDLVDFDARYKEKIYRFDSTQIGFCHVKIVSVDGKPQQLTEHETILEVKLDKPLLPKQVLQLNTVFECQVPKLSRRSGRDNPEGIRYSLGQWYPKLCEYDVEGWHADDYVGREFYGPWGNFEVNITLDKTYKIGASGVLQNANEIGWGYDKEGTELKEINTAKRTWKFKAENVHDFAWVADPGYLHFTRKTAGGPLLHFIYKFTDTVQQRKWKNLADSMVEAYPYMAATFGKYPYPVYSFLHGGGGGTEYPMACMLRGAGLDGGTHEWMHSWYQMMLATNEVEFPWMDEGFTNYADARVQGCLKKDTGFYYASEYDRYLRLAKSSFAEPMSTNANFNATNFAYNYNAYYKGAVFIEQLGYITGAKMRDRILLAYYDQWRYKHPGPNDFMRVAEKESGMELKWYLNYWTSTTKTIDYKIDSLWTEGAGTNVRIKRIGEMPMPLDIVISFKDGSKEMHYVPLNLTRKEKLAEDTISFKTYDPQPYTKKEVVINTNRKLSEITSIEIDPSKRMADIDRRNNKLELKW